jgi:intein/homing endonuclease
MLKAQYPNLASEFVALRSYCRWLPEANRRETWEEVVERVLLFLRTDTQHADKIPSKVWTSIKESMLAFDVMPSMRLTATAGPAAHRENLCIFNCAYLPIDSLKSFSELMYILMAGTGSGFSVERENISKLPSIKYSGSIRRDDYTIEDSREGWAKAFLFGLETWFEGEDVIFDYKQIRPYGSPLLTMGGRASGFEPLRDLIEFSKGTIQAAAGRQLRPIEVHDICCKTAEVVVAGGTRRCLPQGSLISTKRGLVRIEDIKCNDYVLTTNCYRKVTNVFNQGIQNTILIHTQNGVLECTPKHRIAVITSVTGKYKWVQAKNIKAGDRLYFFNASCNGIKTSLPEIDQTTSIHDMTSNDVIIPALDEDIAWLIGLIHGDGYVYYKTESEGKRHGHISISCNNDYPLIKEKVETCFSKFGLSVKRTQGDGNYENLTVYSARLAEYFQHHIKKPKIDICIPDWILTAESNIRAAYIGGIVDSDGCLRTRPVNICTTIYKGYAEQIQNVCSSLGFATRLKICERKEENWKTQYKITVSTPKQLNYLNLMVGKYIVKGTIEIPDSSHCSYSFPSNISNKSDKIYNRNVNISIEQVERYIGPTSFTPVMVLSKSEGRSLVTYDLEIDTIHEFLVNGYLVHNSACISFSDLDDEEMRDAKKIPFPSYRHMANNSVVFKDKPDTVTFLKEWAALAESGTGERGIVNVSNLDQICKDRKFNKIMRLNPCSEILLRPYGLCNLSEVVVRADDDIDDLIEKVKTATWLGVIQSTFTHFPFLRPIWKKNAEEERLIGVSLTGQLDNQKILTDEVLRQLKKVTLKTAKHAAELLNINPPKAYSCSKPSGTVSQVVDSASGCHPRYSRFYIRRYRISKADPLFKLMVEQGMPFKPENNQTLDNYTTAVLEFPVKSPEKAIVRDQWDAMKQLEWYLRVQKNWSTHNVSNTVYVKPNEWIKVGNWVYENFDDIVGISFLPYDDHKYQLAPYEEIDETMYDKLVKAFPKIDFTKLSYFEKETGDKTEVAKTYACTADKCSLT